MDEQVILMRATVHEQEGHLMDIPSFDLDRPQIKEIGTSLTDIQRHVLTGDINIYPLQDCSDENDVKTRLHQCIKSLSGVGLAYVVDNLSESINISKPEPTSRPQCIILDVCLMFQNMSTTVFTLVKDDPESLGNAMSYNKKLVKNVIMAVRRFTTKQFSAVYGLVHEKDLKTQELFQRRLETMDAETSKFCVPHSLRMEECKYKHVIHAFISSVALTSSVVHDDKRDNLCFLTLEQFRILTENIYKPKVIVKTAPSTGGKVLLREVARRLERSGPTLLVLESCEDLIIAKEQNTCSFMMSLEEWRARLKKGKHLEGLTNMVTSCQDCPTMPALNGKCWTFVRELQNVKRSTLLGEKKVDRPAIYEDNEKDRPRDVAFPIQNLSEKKMMETNKRLLFGLSKDVSKERILIRIDLKEIENKDAKIRELMNENKTLKQSKGDKNLSNGPQGATGGQTETAGVIDSIKKILPSRKSKTKAWKKVPVHIYVLYNDDKTVAITLQCREQEMDRERVNTESVYITTDGLLVNYKLTHRGHQGSRRFKEYWGTCGTYQIVLPSSLSSLTPQYWETETEITGNKILVWNIFEVGLVEEDNLDSGVWAFNRRRSWCVMVGHCTTHQTQCVQVWNEDIHVSCWRNTLFETRGSSTTMRFGFVVDAVRGRLGFVDIDKGIVLEKMNVAFKQTVIPVFGVWPDPTYGTVEMRLISGGNIMMTEDKQRLIYTCLR